MVPIFCECTVTMIQQNVYNIHKYHLNKNKIFMHLKSYTEPFWQKHSIFDTIKVECFFFFHYQSTTTSIKGHGCVAFTCSVVVTGSEIEQGRNSGHCQVYVSFLIFLSSFKVGNLYKLPIIVLYVKISILKNGLQGSQIVCQFFSLLIFGLLYKKIFTNPHEPCHNCSPTWQSVAWLGGCVPKWVCPLVLVPSEVG